jgi:hypothetical protein
MSVRIPSDFLPHISVTAVTSPSHASFCMVSASAHGETVTGRNGRGTSHE